MKYVTPLLNALRCHVHEFHGVQRGRQDLQDSLDVLSFFLFRKKRKKRIRLRRKGAMGWGACPPSRAYAPSGEAGGQISVWLLLSLFLNHEVTKSTKESFYVRRVKRRT
jgi:hypothetical protein